MFFVSSSARRRAERRRRATTPIPAAATTRPSTIHSSMSYTPTRNVEGRRSFAPRRLAVTPAKAPGCPGKSRVQREETRSVSPWPGATRGPSAHAHCQCGYPRLRPPEARTWIRGTSPRKTTISFFLSSQHTSFRCGHNSPGHPRVPAVARAAAKQSKGMAEPLPLVYWAAGHTSSLQRIYSRSRVQGEYPASVRPFRPGRA